MSAHTLVLDVRANHRTGVSRYGLSLLRSAATTLVQDGWDLDVVVQPWQHEPARAALAGLRSAVRLHPIDQDAGFLRRSPAVRDLAAEADLFYTTHYLVDRECPIPFVPTVHDLTRIRLPQFNYSDTDFTDRFGRAELTAVEAELDALTAWHDPSLAPAGTFTRYIAAATRNMITSAARVVTVSQASANEITWLLPDATTEIDVVPGGVDTTTFRPRPITEVEAARRSLDVAGPYLLFVGLTHQHKRLDWLTTALMRARAWLPLGSRLVVVGGHAKKSPAAGWLEDGSTDDRFVVFAGRVDDDQLAALYSGAAALLTASLAEGYGLPVQEALACACEVIATALPATQETAGQAAHTYPPDSAVAMVDLAAAALHGLLTQRGAGHPTPRWERSGELLAQVVHRATECASVPGEGRSRLR
jgi:glycosyltransferase involved in cell wall biosynthesis